MANMTRADMITKVLRRLRIIAASETASSADSAIVGEVLDSLHDQLTKKRLVPFPTSAVPDWAQEPFSKIIEEEVGPYFGVARPGKRDEGERELAEQMQAKRHPRPTRQRRY